MDRARRRLRSVARKIRDGVRPDDDVTSRIFPSVDVELGPYRHLFTGRVLNAGAGDRDLSHLVDGDLTNQEIAHGGHPGDIHLWASLEEIPVLDGHFDAVICNAVLEHVLDPERVVAEFARVLAPGGNLYLCVPFLQPEHLDPTDSQRYAAQGLRALCQRHGFDVVEVSAVHSAATTMAWILHEWLRAERRLVPLLCGRVAYELLSRRAAASTRQVHSIASAYRAICVKA